MAKLRAWRFFSAVMALMLIVGLGGGAVPPSPVLADDSVVEWGTGQITQLVNGRVYSIVVTQDCTWELSAPSSAEWELQNPLHQANELTGVWGSSSDDVFVVGNRGPWGDMGAILRYDGSSWTEMSIGDTSELEGVWGSSPNDVFAVGSHGTILHYDGNCWRVDLPPVVVPLLTSLP